MRDVRVLWVYCSVRASVFADTDVNIRGAVIATYVHAHVCMHAPTRTPRAPTCTHAHPRAPTRTHKESRRKLTVWLTLGGKESL